VIFLEDCVEENAQQASGLQVVTVDTATYKVGFMGLTCSHASIGSDRASSKQLRPYKVP